jgi:hypothetical protein
MHKSATKCNETVGKWCKNKHGASKIIDMLETYQGGSDLFIVSALQRGGDGVSFGAACARRACEQLWLDISCEG